MPPTSSGVSIPPPEGQNLLELTDQLFDELQTVQEIPATPGIWKRPNTSSFTAIDSLGSRYPFDESTIRLAQETLNSSALPFFDRLLKVRKNLKSASKGVAGSIVGLTDRPIPLLVASTVATFMIVFFSTMFVQVQFESLHLVLGTLMTFSMVSVLIIQCLALYRHHQLKYAVICTGLWFGLIAFSLFALSLKVGFAKNYGSTHVDFSRLDMILVVQLAGLLMSLTLGLAFVFISIFGSFMSAKKAEKRDRLQTRTELLRRYFEIRERLKRAKLTSESNKLDRIRNWVNRYGVVLAIILGLSTFILFDLVNTLQRGGIVNRSLSLGSPTISLTLIQTVIGLLSLVMVSVIALAPTSLIRAFICTSTMLFTEGIAFLAVLIHPFGLRIAEPYTSGYLIFHILSGFVVAGAVRGALLGAAQSQWQGRIERNDPDALIVELARLRSRLNISNQGTAILAVDAAKSTLMKVGEDPMIAELAFREYQDWIQKTSHEKEGRVHATAGDGAIVAFQGIHNAYLAAKKLQSSIDLFNIEKNRLASPFRIRIGIHSGQLQGHVDEIMFTSVIDVAAHIESVAPIGGIAMSEVARNVLSDFMPNERFALLPEEVDGYSVFVAINPREDS